MDPAVAQNKYQKRDDASARLGEKLLQGWTMLGVHCPQDECFTPLMRNKEGKMFCVGCQAFVITAEEAQKQQEEKDAKEEEERKQLIAARFAQEQLERQQAEREREMQLQYERQQQQAQAQAKPQATPQRAPAPVAVNGPVKRKSVDVADVQSDDSVHALRRQTLAALYKKLEELTASLSTSDHSERLLTTSKAIHELAQAIRSMSS